MVEKNVKIKEITKQDIQSIVEIHLQSFDGFFLTFMGRKFLEVLYRSICKHKSGIGFYCEVNHKIAGFVIGTTHLSGLYSELLKKNIHEFGMASIQPILRRPVIIPRLIRALALPKHERSSEDCATLMSIAVVPEYQGNGVGKKLVNRFLIEAETRGERIVNLKTDAKNNDKANNFYQSLGFTLHHTYTTPEGREMNEYRITLESSNIN